MADRSFVRHDVPLHVGQLLLVQAKVMTVHLMEHAGLVCVCVYVYVCDNIDTCGYMCVRISYRGFRRHGSSHSCPLDTNVA